MIDYCERGLTRLTWQEFRTERLTLIKQGWTERSVHIGVCRFTRFGQCKTLILVKRIG